MSEDDEAVQHGVRQGSAAVTFHVGSRVVAPEWWIREIEFDRDTAHCLDERRVSLAAVASEIGVGGVFEYHYDMGDGWEHRIAIETPPGAWMDSELPVWAGGVFDPAGFDLNRLNRDWRGRKRASR